MERVIPIPEEAKPEIRMLLQGTQWNNQKISQVSAAMAVGIQEQISDARDRLWSYIFSTFPKSKEMGDNLIFDKESFRVLQLDSNQKETGESLSITKDHYAPLMHLHRKIEIAEESRSAIAHVVKQLEAESELAFLKLMSALRRYIPEMNSGGLWGVDPSRMVVYETDEDSLADSIKNEEQTNQAQ